MPEAHYLIVNAFGRSNRGDSVLLDQCIEQIRIANPQARITGALFEDLPSAEAAHPDVSWSQRIGNSVRFRGARGRLESLLYMAIGYLSLKLGWRGLGRLLPRPQRRTLEAFRTADIVVGAPGGYIHDTNLAYVIALFHIHLAHVMGIPSVLAPQSVGPLISRPARAIARRVLSRCVSLCVRERFSEKFLLDLGLPPERLRLTGDSAFWDGEVSVDKGEVETHLARVGLEKGERFLGCTIVDWTFPNMENVPALRSRYFEGMAKVLTRIHVEHGLRTVVFNQVASDLDVVKAVAEKAKGAVLVDSQNREPSLMRALIARSHLFLGTRFHSCIFAMIAGRAVTAISYLPKTEYIMRELGLTDFTVDIAHFDAGQLYAGLNSQLLDIRTAERRVRDAVAHYQATQIQFHQVLKDFSFD